MNKTLILASAAVLIAWPAAAQSSSSSQTNGANSSQATASIAKSGTQAEAGSSSAASQNTQASRSRFGQKRGQGSASGSASNSTSASANAGPASLNLSSGTTVDAVLETTLDAKHSKPGDRVVAKTLQDVKQGGHVILRRGTNLIGHITEAQARGEDSAESSLGIVFDHAVLRKGQEAPAGFAIQALASAQAAASAAAQNDDLMAMGSGSTLSSGAVSSVGRSGGGLLGGVNSTVSSATGVAGGAGSTVGRTTNATVGATGNAAGSVGGNAGGLNALGQLTSTSSGVFGLNGLSLSSDLSNATQGSLVISANRNVHLASGTQMLLRVVNQSQAQN